MTDNSGQGAQLSPLKRAYLAIEKLQARLEAAERGKREPIAIVGMGCRFPGGANSPEAFWQLLIEGVDAITEVPADRWPIDDFYDPDPDAPGKMSTRWGGFLDQVDQFDPQLFGIAPREVVRMDPQQRLLLEVAWEALEDAGQPPDCLSGSRTGVFVGLICADYERIQLGRASAGGLDAYFASGTAHSIASGRLSYVFGLQGPSVSLDTACSSSLLTVHLACQSLRSGECRMALAGGVNVMLIPEPTMALSKFRMMAPDGRCKTFDARADGYVRGEGCGIVVLKRLSDALADNDRILAVVEGTAANQDGPSSGLTAPNGLAQEAVIRNALEMAGRSPAAVGYVEAHGTGTALGDPIELQALAAALGEGREEDKPILVGSVKTNIGHLESAAGVAGLIKAALVVQNREVPPLLHLHEPNPLIPWNELPVSVPTERTPWPAGAPVVAGVSSFGFSGTNVHAIVSEPPELGRVTVTVERPTHLLTLSANDSAALKGQARRFRDHIEAIPVEALPDVCFSANVGRAQLAHRVAVVTDSLEGARESLAAVVDGKDLRNTVSGRVEVGARPRVAFLFSGQGSQYAGMGRTLYETQPTFRQVLDQCDELLRAQLEHPLLHVLYGQDDLSASKLSQTAFTQPALFAIEYALAELWRSWGVKPTAVLGHSLGEYTAACVAGVFSLKDGLRLVAERGRLMQSLPAGGKMAAVSAGRSDLDQLIAPFKAQVSISAENGPTSVAISGAGAAVQAAVEKIVSKGIRVQYLNVSHAFHSSLMEPILQPFEQLAGQVSYSSPTIKLVSNVSGQWATGEDGVSAQYWRRHLRQAVQFRTAMSTLGEYEIDQFVEIGPGSTLLAMGRRCLPETKADWFPSLRKGREDWQQILKSLAGLHVRGVSIDWDGFDRDYARKRVALPTYPFQRKRYWINDQPRKRESRASKGAGGHPLLGERLRSAHRDIQFEGLLDVDAISILDDHRVHGVAIMPATGYIEMGLAASMEALGTRELEQRDLVFVEPMVLDDDQVCIVQTLVSLDEGGATWRVHSLEKDEEGTQSWRHHAAGRAVSRSAPSMDLPSGAESLDRIRSRCQQEVAVEDLYGRFWSRGLQLGPSFQGVTRIWRREGEALGRIELPETMQSGGFQIHPALLDACFHVLEAALPGGQVDTETMLPMGLEAIRLFGKTGNLVWSQGTIRLAGAGSGGTFVGDVRILDELGRLVGQADGLVMRRVEREVLFEATRPKLAEWLYQVAWRPKPGGTSASETALPSPDLIAAHLAAALQQSRGESRLKSHSDLLSRLEKLSVEFILRSLVELGWNPLPGQEVSVSSLSDELGVVPNHQQLLGRFLAILAEEGMLRDVGDRWEVCEIPRAADPKSELDSLSAQFPSSRAPLTLVSRCGQELAPALTGAANPLELLFPNGSLAITEDLYQDSPEALVFNRLVADAIAAAVRDFPAEQSVRILEVGAGTGGTTQAVLPRLPAERTEYLFSDISPLFLARARDKFGEYPFIKFQQLDVELDPERQGFSQNRYHIVLAANVLHATAELQETLSHVQQLLVPGGLVVLLEGTAPERWIDITFGLTEGWWRFRDRDLRPAYPLLAENRWQSLLLESGFTSVAAVSLPSSLSNQALVLAQAPGLEKRGGDWMILADRGGVGHRLAERMLSKGMRCLLVTPGESYRTDEDGVVRVNPGSPGDFARLLSEQRVADRPVSWDGIIHLWSLDVPRPETTDLAAIRAGQELAVGSALHLVQALSTLETERPPQLWLVTQGGQAAGSEPKSLNVSQSPVWGLAKVVTLEHPELQCVCVDLDPAGGESESEFLVNEILSPDGEDQVAIRHGERYVPRLERYQDPAAPDKTKSSAWPVRLEIPNRGVLDNLSLLPATRNHPGPGQVEIKVKAASLNFRDVLNALGMRPGDLEPLGAECVGEIAAVGSQVQGLRVGDPVIALAPGSIGTYATASADFVVRKPPSLSWDEAATIPISFVTAYLTLCYLASISSGDTVLIHAAAGGVGMAAVQLAQRAGAEVFGTAGNPAKRELLRSMGVQHVMDSRSLSFAEEVLEVTHGRGVDIVLNSLSDEFAQTSLSVLAQDGQFLEIGKRGVLEPEQVARMRPDVSYYLVDGEKTTRDEPELMRAILLEVMVGINDGTLQPLPRRLFPLDKATDAFRYMAQAKHVGKVVIACEPGIALASDASYLITGGLGALGLAVARWMVDQGMRYLVLVGRSAPTPATRGVLDELEASGARIMVAQADVSQGADVAAVLATMETTMPPLRGMIHAAGILDDGALLKQDWQRFARVMAPKVEGAWILHEQTKNMPLDFFVQFSSIASLLGSPGQGNHASANAFLDGLAYHRRAHGLPGVSINWGAWSEIGAAAERGVDARLAGQGMGTIGTAEGVEVFSQLLRQAPPQVAVMPVDWARFSTEFAGGRIFPFISELVKAAPRRGADPVLPAPQRDLQEELVRLPPGKRKDRLRTYVQDQARNVLGLDPSQVLEENLPLGDLGLDSLMAVELRNSLGSGLGLDRLLPATLVFDYPTVEEIATYLADKVLHLDLGGGPESHRQEEAVGRGYEGGHTSDLLDALEELSDDEVDRLYSQQMEGQGNGTE